MDTVEDIPKPPKDDLSDESRKQFGDTPRASVEEMPEIGRLFVEHRSRPVQLSTDHGLWLYDEFGLPRHPDRGRRHDTAAGMPRPCGPRRLPRA